MEYNKQKAEAGMEQLKKEILEVVSRVEDAAQELGQKHPRYALNAARLASCAASLQRNCEGSLFSIALGAAFQSGKSTTINAMADGREICPRGNGGGGIRTSSCAVRVSCALDGSPAAELSFMDAEALDAELRYALDADGEAISLKNPENVEDAWKTAAHTAAALWRDPMDYDEKERDKIKQALLLLSFHDDPRVEAYRRQQSFTEREVRSFLSFTADVLSRWNAVFAEADKLRAPMELKQVVRSQFTVEQAMYVFINIVNYATPSEYLRSLGVQVIDTPGLNMSDNDTKVALSAMQESCAIFYFFSGERQLDEADKAALKLIRTSGLAEKVFFGINFRRPLIKSEAIEQAIQADLQLLGYDLEHQRSFLHYNAFLAQRAKQGSMLLKGTLDEAGKQALMAEAKAEGIDAETVEEAWLETTDAVMRAVRAEGYRDFYDMGLTEESVALVLAASRWEETMQAINDYVLRNRGSSLLVDRLSKPVRLALQEVENTLRGDEEAAEADEEEMKKRYEDAISRYDAFSKEGRALISKYIDEGWDRMLARNYYEEVYETCCQDAAQAAAETIQKQTTLTRSLGQMGVSLTNRFRRIVGAAEKKSELETITELAVQRGFANSITPRNIAWQENLEKSDVYGSVVRSNVENLNEAIMNRWEAMNMDDNEALSKLRGKLQQSMPVGQWQSDIDALRFSSSDYNKLIDGGNKAMARVAGLLATWGVTTASMMGSFAGLAAIYLYILPADFIIPGIAEILTVVAGIIAAIAGFFTSRATKAKREKKELDAMISQLKEKFSTALSDSEYKNNQIAKLIAGDEEHPGSGLQCYRLFYHAAFNDAFDGCRKQLEDDRDAALRALEESSERRRLIALEACAIRTETMEPLRKELEALEVRVKDLCQ